MTTYPARPLSRCYTWLGITINFDMVMKFLFKYTLSVHLFKRVIEEKKTPSKNPESSTSSLSPSKTSPSPKQKVLQTDEKLLSEQVMTIRTFKKFGVLITMRNLTVKPFLWGHNSKIYLCRNYDALTFMKHLCEFGLIVRSWFWFLTLLKICYYALPCKCFVLIILWVLVSTLTVFLESHGPDCTIL